MKRLLWIIVAMAGLVAMVTGCDGMHRYDGRLEAADSLMHDDPDSALALVEAIDAGSLTTDGDRAYRDLLLTQARYRCYIAATSDSAINRALAYYRAHDGEREKLTRCHLYKGAVMGELGQVDSAMFYYKTAEVTAAPDDYFNLGQINTRIADLYRLYYGDEETCFEKYKQALHFHRLTGNKRQQQNCLFNMANFTNNLASDSAGIYLRQSLDLATASGDSGRVFDCKELQCRWYIADNCHLNEAKRIALQCLNDYSRFVNTDLILDLATIYAIEDNVDSARVFLDALEGASLDGQYLARKYWAQSLIAKSAGDLRLSNAYRDSSDNISDSINCNENRYQIQRIENANVAQQAIKKNKRINSLRWLLISLALSFIVVISILSFYHYRRINKVKAILAELKASSINNHEALLEQIDAKNGVIEQFVRDMVSFMQVSIDASEHDSPTIMRKRIQQGISGMAKNEEFWSALRDHLDKNYNNIISTFAKNPRLDEKELRFIELSCCGFNYVEIAIALDYNPNYISTKRKTIARKLHVWIPLQDHLDNLLRDNNPKS